LINLFVKLLIISAISISCSNAGETLSSGGAGGSSDVPVNLNSAVVSGIIKGPSGSQTELSGWIVGFSEVDTQVVHLGSISAVGYYQVGGVNLNKAQTMFLLTSDYKLKAVLSAPGSTLTSLYQYFTINSSFLPTITYSNKVLTFEDISVFNWTGSEVLDGDSNLVPDGLINFSLRSSFNLAEQDAVLALSSTDMDFDDLSDTADYDVDGDGLANWMDTDDDGDGVPDWVDLDANGDGTIDSSDPYLEKKFTYGLESFSVQLKYSQILGISQTFDTWEKDFIFQAKKHPTTEVDSVRMMGSTSLFNNAQKLVMTSDPTVAPVPTAWDKNLEDNGLSEDSIADDGIYGIHVRLSGSALISENETVFFDVTSGSEKYQFGFAIPDVTINKFTTTVSEATRTITAYQTTQPIAATDMYWYAKIFDVDGNLKYQSTIISDTSVATFTIPTSVTLDAATDYVNVVFYSASHAQSSPSIIVESADISFSP
jgi:hypothetical protein